MSLTKRSKAFKSSVCGRPCVFSHWNVLSCECRVSSDLVFQKALSSLTCLFVDPLPTDTGYQRGPTKRHVNAAGGESWAHGHPRISLQVPMAKPSYSRGAPSGWNRHCERNCQNQLLDEHLLPATGFQGEGLAKSPRVRTPLAVSPINVLTKRSKAFKSSKPKQS